jgi:hypothetical protein
LCVSITRYFHYVPTFITYLLSLRTYFHYVPTFITYLLSLRTYFHYVPTFITYLLSLRTYFHYVPTFITYLLSLRTYFHYVPTFITYLLSLRTYFHYVPTFITYLLSLRTYFHYIPTDPTKVLDSKVCAIREWPQPKNVQEVMQFYILVNYYCCFIRHVSMIAVSLSDLFKSDDNDKQKRYPIIWSAIYQVAFVQLKEAIMTAPVLIQSDPMKPYTIETDSLDFRNGMTLY